MDRTTLTSSIEDYLETMSDAGDIHVEDDDFYNIAIHIEGAVKHATDRGEIRKAVEGACTDLGNGGMLEGSSEVEQGIVKIVTQHLSEIP